MFKKFFTLPARNLVFVIPVVISAALACGYFIDTSALKLFLLPTAMFAVFPAMIGLRLQEVVKVEAGELSLIFCCLLFNFLLVPALAVLVGYFTLSSWPDLYVGLLIISVMPGGNMVMAFTLLLGGNVPASLKISTMNLLLGGIMAPVYLHFLAGSSVSVDMMRVWGTVGLVVFIPLTLGLFTYQLLRRRFSEADFKSKIKPILPAISAWFMIYIIFTSVSVKAKMMISQPEIFLHGLLALACWYGLIIALVATVGRWLFTEKNGITLLLNVELRNLAIAMGVAVTAFSSETAMIVALAFLFQQQGAIWFCRFSRKFNFFRPDSVK